MKKRLLYLVYSLFFFLPAIGFGQTANHVVISELFGGNGVAYSFDWIELYNPTNADVDMSNWSVQYNSATGNAAFSGNTTFPAGTIIKAHGYYLIQEQGTAGSGTGTLPTADLATTGTTNNFNMSSVAGKVALVNNSTTLAAPPTLPASNVVDLVAYGTTVTYSEGGTGATFAAPALTSATTIERKASATSTAATMATGGSEDGKGNGYDSDVNSADFFVPTVSNPQNSASPLETPAGSGTSTATLTASTASLDFGTTITPVGSSAVKTFTLTGANLTAGATLTVAAPYTVSSDGTTYGLTATFTAAQLATAQTVSVKFSPVSTTAAPGSVSIVSAGATTQTVTLTGTGVSATPTLTASATTLTFASQAANTTSTAQTFTISGTALSTNTTVSVAAPFAVSKDGISYSTVISYTPAELATAQTVSVVFAPTAAGTPTATITVASSGATSKTVALSGTATAASGGTSSGANHVVISELFGGNGVAYSFDWIELYNPTAADVDMSNWSVQYNSATGNAAFSGNTTFPAGSIIKAHGYYLVQEQGTAGSGTGTLPTADLATTGTTNNFNMSSVAGKIALVNNSTTLAAPPTLPASNVVDLVAYGTTVTYSEGGTGATFAAPALTSATTIERKASATSTAATMAAGGSEDGKGNGYDSDVNSADFFVPTVSNPQNSASPLETPPGGGAATASPSLTVATTPATSPAAIDFGTTQTINSTSAAKTFTLSGANLTAGVVLTVAAPYSISADNVTYGLTATFTAAQLATAQTVYVKFTPTTTTATTGSVSITSAGAIGQGVILTGTGSNVVAVPTVTATPNSLAFGNVNTTAPSVKTFSLSGSTLTSATTVAATAPYTVSKDGTNFAASVSYTAVELATAQTVSVKFTPTAAGAANSNVTLTNPDLSVSPVNVAVTGTGVVPTLTTATTPASTPTTVAFGNVTISTTSGAQSFTLTGANITGSTTLTTTAPYTLSTDGGTTYGLTGTITAATLATAQTILVKYSPTALGASTGNIAITSNGATTQNVALTGTGVAAPVPTLTLTPSTLTFSGLVGSTSAAQSYTISGANLTGNSTVTVAAPYSIATTATGTYGTTLNYTTAQLATTQTVFVKFSPTVVAVNGVNNGIAANATVGGTTQNVTLSGTGIGVPTLTATTTPATTPTALTFSQITGTTSAAQSFTLTGAYITANTTVTVAAPYAVSKTATGGYSTSITFTTTDMATPQTVYVQFTAPATLGAANGTATIASTGANSPTVTLNGTSLGVPTLTVTPAAVTASATPLTFATAVGSSSAAQTFTLAGANLTAGGSTVVTAPASFTVSKDGTTYSSSISYSVADLATAQTVSVKYTPTAVSNPTAATITIASPNATGVTVYLSGAGVNSAPTLTAIADQSACFSTALQTIPLAGITPGAETAQTTVVSVTSSNPLFFASLGTSPISGGASAINYVLANSAVSGTVTITVTVKDNGGTANGGTDTFVRTFVLTVNPFVTLVVTSDAANNIVDKGATATLTVTGGLPGATYNWTSSDTRGIITSVTTGTSITIRPTFFSTYKVTSTNACGTAITGQLGVEVRTLAKLETSNVLTPNGDGINDVWVVRNIDLYPANTVKVYNKAGKLVYTKTGYNNDWNGTYNGTPLIQGTYYYVVDLGTGLTYTGYVSIVRD